MADRFYEGVYNPQVVEEYLNEVLDTNLAVEAFCNVDNQLKSAAGEKIEVWRYNDSGEAETLDYGEGNTGYSDIDGTPYYYTVLTVQDRVKIYDEDIEKSPRACALKMEVAPKHLINAMRRKVVNEWYKTSNCYAIAGDIPSVEELILAQSSLDLGLDNGLNGGADTVCLFLNPKDYRKFQAYLVSENVIVGAEIINGKKYNTVAGIPFEASDLITEGAPVFATNNAVRLIHSNCKNTEVERDSNVRLSTYYVRDRYMPYLEFIKKALILGEAAAITATPATNGTYKLNGQTGDIDSVIGGYVQVTDITPAAGYELDTITVSAGTLDADNGFKVESDATVTVTFKAI